MTKEQGTTLADELRELARTSGYKSTLNELRSYAKAGQVSTQMMNLSEEIVSSLEKDGFTVFSELNKFNSVHTISWE